MRLPKQSIYLHIDYVDDSQLHLLSGRYYLHSIKNKTPTFERAGGNIPNFPHSSPYFLTYDNEGWCLRDARFLKNPEIDLGTWLKHFTKGCFQIIYLNPKS